ncbi:MAG: PadR family transcriptional regulator [Pseudonocardiales bacterium]
MPSNLGYALLGLLARAPRTGYQLSQAMREPIGFFWSASHSQVYPELAGLESARLVRHRVVDGPGPRENKQYRLTPAGRRALADWVVEPAAPPSGRDEFLLKIYSLWTAEPARARDLVTKQREQHHEMLARYQEMEQEFVRDAPSEMADPSTRQFSAYATLRRGLSFERHAIAWCDWLVEQLDAGPRRS